MDNHSDYEDNIGEDSYWEEYFKPTLEFFTTTSLIKVDVPKELENEPYAIVDTGLRPEIKIPSKISYLFELGSDEIWIRIGQKMWTIDITTRLPGKKRTRISVLDIYENYGIDVAYSYLSKLYYNPISRINIKLMVAYLESSLMVINPEFQSNIKRLESVGEFSDMYALHLSSLLLLELTGIENKRPYVPIDLPKETTINVLPEDIVTKIVGSTRLSKSTAEKVISNRCASILTEDELYIASLYTESIETRKVPDRDKYYAEYEQDNIYYEYSITGSYPGPFHLNYLQNQNDFIEEYDPSYGYSLSIYKEAYRHRGCPTTKYILKLLKNISEMEINKDNYGDACFWIIQLGVDSEKYHIAVLDDYRDLENMLHIVASNTYDLINKGLLKIQ
jgi:hypothetical protein